VHKTALNIWYESRPSGLSSLRM